LVLVTIPNTRPTFKPQGGVDSWGTYIPMQKPKVGESNVQFESSLSQP
jgi:hypothetical protein